MHKEAMFTRLLHLIFLLVSLSHEACALPKSINNEKKKSYIDTLHEALTSGETFFIKVHAAEALITNNQTKGIESLFTELLKQAPSNKIGAARVLAKLYKKNPQQYQVNVAMLIDEMLYADSLRQKLTALESLAKVHYKTRLPHILLYADTGRNGFKGMARWVLSNSGRSSDEVKLAELLTSTELLDYRYASYALRFKNKVSSKTYKLLELLDHKIGNGDPAKVYVASTLFVHAQKDNLQQAKKKLLAYEKGTVGEQYEVAEALAIKGDASDIQLLQQLLKNSNRDVRVAAANALLRIGSRINKIKEG
jgi:HEAT repeat protein